MPNYTLTYNERSKGWPSFYSYLPDWMIGMNNYFYTFKSGNLYRHNVNSVRNQFYGVNYSSTIQSVFNDSPLVNKLFKTLNIEGDDAWGATLSTDLQSGGFALSSYFEKKEASYFSFIRNSGTVPASPSEYALRSVNGIGRSASIVSTVPSAVVVNYAVAIGSIVSIGRYIKLRQWARSNYIDLHGRWRRCRLWYHHEAWPRCCCCQIQLSRDDCHCLCEWSCRERATIIGVLV